MSSQTDQGELIQAALQGESEEERCAAIGNLTDLASLRALLEQHGPVHDAAELRLHTLLGASAESDPPQAERLAAIEVLEPAACKQVAMLAKCKAAGAAAIGRVVDAQDLADLCLFAASAAVRKAAAARIHDPELAKDLIARLDGKDKSVLKVLSASLSEPAATPPAENSAPAPAVADISPLLDPHLELFRQLQEMIAPEQLAALLAVRAQLPADLRAIIRAKPPGMDEEKLLFTRLLAAVAKLEELGQEINALATSVASLSHKNSTQVNKSRKEVRRFKSEIGWPRNVSPTVAYSSLLELERKIEDLVAINTQHQSGLVEATDQLIAELRTFLDEGKSAEAGQAWDRIQGNISNLSGAACQGLKERTLEFKTRIAELRDWKNFAATEKKKELISQMQHLLETRMDAPDKARLINKLHHEWKELGRSAQNEKLWKEFKKVSDLAYEPCKEYFKQQKSFMAENLRQRIYICDQLEKLLGSPELSGIKLVDLRNIETKAMEDWKRFAPVEQSKIKNLQKRFYAALNSLRDLRRGSMNENSQRKQDLVEQARKLVDVEDQKQAMEQAKSLQAEWKTIGPANPKEDKKFWEEFRAACDAVFSKRDQARREVSAAIGDALQEVGKTLRELEQLMELDDDGLRDTRKIFATLQREFQRALNPKIKKERKQLLERFDTLVRKIETRFRKLPDKKTLQMRQSLEARSEYCLDLETELLSCDDDAALTRLVHESDGDAWAALPLCGDVALDAAMQQRLDVLLSLRTCRDLHNLLQVTAAEARRGVIELEIRANVDSPESDRARRMEIQLNQLRDKFGKAPDPQENGRYGRDFELTFLCMGPLPPETRAELRQRVAKAVDRLR